MCVNEGRAAHLIHYKKQEQHPRLYDSQQRQNRSFLNSVQNYDFFATPEIPTCCDF